MQRLVLTDKTIGLSGFTLIELMVVSSVIAIIVGIAAPNLGRFIESQRLNGGQKVLSSNLKYTQSEAVTRNASVTMCIYGTSTSCDTASSATWNQGWHIFIDLDTDQVIDPNEVALILKTQPAFPNLTFFPATGEENVTFVGSGQAMFPAGVSTITISTCQNNPSNLDCTDTSISSWSTTLLRSGQIVTQEHSA